MPATFTHGGVAPMYHGNALQLTRLASGIGHLCFDLQGSAVNKFNRLTLDELRDVLVLVGASDLRGLVCSSAKGSFIVGADIAEFASLFQQPAQVLKAWGLQCNALFTALAGLPIPTACLVDGQALGGGFEFCLATDYRVASEAAVFGFPEVGLGICPGFGGTVRAPRVMDLQPALSWILSGTSQSAADALAAGAIDALVDSNLLMDAALEYLEEALQSPADWQARRARKQAAVAQEGPGLSQVLAEAHALLHSARNPHNPAPLSTQRSLEQSVLLPAAQALELESACFVALAQSNVATNLIGLFTGEQWLRQKTRQWQAQALPVKRVAVLGAGIMGGGIAYQAALKGLPVVMKDIAQTGLDAGMKEAGQLLQKQVQKGRLSAGTAQDVLGSIQPTLDYTGFDGVDLVVEAVVENQNVKQKVLAEVESRLAPGAVLASNTSTISITALARSLARPEQFCGMHFFNPVPLMPLVEVIRGEHSSAAAIATTVACAQRMGKTPIVVRDCPGFLVNRILFPYFGAFSMLLRDGADYREIDAAMEAFGWPMGPAWLLDVVGIDTAVHAQAVMAAGFPERMHYEFKSAMQLLFEAGQLGQKTGSGFYRYTADKTGRLQKQLDEDCLARIRVVQGPARQFTAGEIVERMMLAMCLETARCLEDGIVDTAVEADMSLVLGLGFPRFRGGALRYIDSMGARAFCAQADRHAALGPLYFPTAGLRAMAAADSRFYA